MYANFKCVEIYLTEINTIINLRYSYLSTSLTWISSNRILHELAWSLLHEVVQLNKYISSSYHIIYEQNDNEYT